METKDMTAEEKLKLMIEAFNFLMSICNDLPWTIEDMVRDSYSERWEAANEIAGRR